MAFRRNFSLASDDDDAGAEERSVDFSVDPMMYEKLGISKARSGEMTEFEQQKVYDFQLDKDIRKLVDKRGNIYIRNIIIVSV